MRQVEEVELDFVLRLAIRKIGAAAVKGLQSNQADVRDRCERIVSKHLAASMARYEILTDAPPYPGASGEYMVNGRTGA